MIVESNSVETFREQNTVRQDEVSGDCSDQWRFTWEKNHSVKFWQ